MISSSLEEEIWKELPDFNGKYLVSSLGKIKRLDKKIGKFVELSYRDRKGYKAVSLSQCKGVFVTYSVHRLVLKTFIGESDLQVDHINGEKYDNRLSNLRYLNVSDNINNVKTLNPNKYTSRLHGVYLHKNRWVSNITISNTCYNLGSFDTDVEGHEAYKLAKYNWEVLGELPKKVRPKKYTSLHQGVGFHKVSNKWRVRVNGTYIGLFETEVKAIRVFNIVQFLHLRGKNIDRTLVKKLKNKYGRDNRFKYIFRCSSTGFETDNGEVMAKHLGVTSGTFNRWKLKNQLGEKGIIILQK